MTLGKSVTMKGTLTPDQPGRHQGHAHRAAPERHDLDRGPTHTATVSAGGTYSNGYKPGVTGSYRAETSIAATSSHGAITTAWQGFTVN